jgi:VWFA-related protein
MGIALAQPGVVIRSTTRLVQVHVVALDNSGSPVSGLRKEDFRIFDERKERPLVLFTVEGAEPVARLAAGPDEQGDAGNGYSAILLDWLNGGFADRLRGDDAVRKVLKTFPPRQQVALYVLGMEPPNSTHPLRLVSGLEDPMILPRPDMTDAPGKFDARSGSGSRVASVEEQLFDWRSRILDTVRALADLAGDMAHIPGRKSLIWLTTGFPMIMDGSVVPGARAAEELYLKDVDRVVAQLNRMDVTVHTVNTKGLSAVGRSFGATLRDFAERTGGTMFSDRNDLDTGVRAALEDMHAGYTLGFLVPEDASPGMHAIQVRIARPHVKLRFRESYELGN